MADTYGSLSVPAQVVSSPPAVFAQGDPLLGWVADFLKAVLTANATAAWQAAAPGFPVVRRVILENPSETVFDTRDLPALYVFRDDKVRDQAIEWLADDYRYAVSTVHAWWVMPITQPANSATRYPFPNAIDKVIDAAVEAGRDPSWMVSGDPDPQAATLGSVLATYAGWDIFGLRRCKRTKLRIVMQDAKPMVFEMLAMDFHCEELLVRDIASMGAPNDEIDLTYEIPDDGTGLGPLDVDDADLT